MKRFIWFFIICCMAFMTAISFAQSSMDSDYNFCSDPTVWGNGHCENSDSNITTCMWEMGWYLPRVAAGEFNMSDIKTPCLFVVVNEDTTVMIETRTNAAGCRYLVVVLNGSPYTGKSDINVAGNDYDGYYEDLGDCQGLEIHGNNNNNSLTGSPNDDLIYGYDGDDSIYGDSCCLDDGSGDDIINGGSGNDTIYGDSFDGNGSGDDTINGGNGDDFILGDSEFGNGSGDDTINGGNGDDTIYGDSGSGNGSGDDTINGNDGNDSANGSGNSEDTTDVETDNSTPDN